MKRLSKEHRTVRADLVERLHVAAEEAIRLIEAANVGIEAYNAVVAEVQTFREDVVGDMDMYVEQRSEKWEDSDAGIKYTEWKDSFEALEVDEIEAIQVPDDSLADALEGLAEEPEQV